MWSKRVRYILKNDMLLCMILKIYFALQPVAGGNEEDPVDEADGPQEQFEVGLILHLCPTTQDTTVCD